MARIFALTAAGGVSDSLKTALTTIASDMTGVIGDIVPIAVPVIGGILVVTLGIKAFKKFSK